MTGKTQPAAAPATIEDARAAYDSAAAAQTLDDLYDAADSTLGVYNPERVAQLRAALDTARMAVEYLSTETPYRAV